jgi:hypothetical protein
MAIINTAWNVNQWTTLVLVLLATAGGGRQSSSILVSKFQY